MNAPLPPKTLAPPPGRDRATAPPEPAAADLSELLDEPRPRRWFRRPAVWLTALAVVAVAAGGMAWQAQRDQAAQPVYTTQPVARGKLTLNVTANGTLQPTRTISIGSELSGTVQQVLVDVNDRVRQGQVLVVLDTAKLRDQITRSQAALAGARARVAQSQATVKEAQASLQRYEEVWKLSGGKVPSQAELEGARAALARALADEKSTRASVTEAQATVSSDQTSLSKAAIRAPADGVVLTRSVDPGNAVAASLQAVTLFTIAEDLSKLRLQVNVDEADVGSVKPGQAAHFTVSAYPARKYPAQITRVAYGSTTTDNVVTYQTQLDVDNADLTLRPGMTATATIAAVQRDDALLVPNAALRFSPVERGARAPAGAASGGRGIVGSLMPQRPPGMGRRNPGSGGNSANSNANAPQQRRVYVLRDGAAVAVPVTTGISDGRFTEVLDGGLQAGMQVITDQKTTAAK